MTAEEKKLSDAVNFYITHSIIYMHQTAAENAEKRADRLRDLLS